MKYQKEGLQLKLYFFLWKNFIPNKFENLAFDYSGEFTVQNLDVEAKSFKNTDLKISSFNNSNLINILAQHKRENYIDSVSNTENIECFPILNKQKYFIIAIGKIFDFYILKHKMHFFIEFILSSVEERKKVEIAQLIDRIELSNNSKQLFKLVINQEELEILETPKKEMKINNNENDFFKYLSNENEIEYKDNFQIEAIEILVLSRELNIENEPEYKNELKVKNALEKIDLIFKCKKSKIELISKHAFFINFLKQACNSTIEDQILLFTQKIKIEKFTNLFKNKEKRFLKKFFKKYLRKTIQIKETEEREELEFFQSTNYSLILLGLLERIFMKKVIEKEIFYKFFSKYKLISLQANFHNLMHKFKDLDNINLVNQIANKKTFLLNRIFSSINQKRTNETMLKTNLYKWKIINLKSTSIEHISILNSLPNLEEEFTERITEVEYKYKNIMEKNKLEFEKIIGEKNNEMKNKQNEINKLCLQLQDLKFNFDNEKNNLNASIDK